MLVRAVDDLILTFLISSIVILSINSPQDIGVSGVANVLFIFDLFCQD
jgi:hypothetical protein